MVNLILIILLLFGLLMGLKRGFVLQILHLTGFFVSFYLANRYYDQLAPHLVLWIPYPDMISGSDQTWTQVLEFFPLESVFYNVISFMMIFFGSKIALQLIASMLDFVAELPLIYWVNRLLGASLGFLEIYLVIFIVLFFLALIPIPIIQSSLNESSVALLILDKTPILSEKIKLLWQHMRF